MILGRHGFNSSAAPPLGSRLSVSGFHFLLAASCLLPPASYSPLPAPAFRLLPAACRFLDRFLQPAVLQGLQREWDRTVSPHSYGFRPHRSAQQAVAQAQQHLADGYGWVVDLDWEKFFDRVHHAKLMGQVATRSIAQRLLRRLRAVLTAGGRADGLGSPTGEGTPHGGPLSPLLSNLGRDPLDRARERRGHRVGR